MTRRPGKPARRKPGQPPGAGPAPPNPNPAAPDQRRKQLASHYRARYRSK